MSRVNVARDGKVWVRHAECDHCLLGPNRIVSGARARQLIADTAAEGATFVCHRNQTHDEPEAICRGWWDRYSGDDITLRLAVALGLVEFTPPPA